MVAKGIGPRWVKDEWEATGVSGKYAAATVFEAVVDFGMELASQPGTDTRRQSRGLRRGSLGSSRDLPEKTRPNSSIQTQYNDNRRGNRLNKMKMGADARMWMMRWGWEGGKKEGEEVRSEGKSERERKQRLGAQVMAVGLDWASRGRELREPKRAGPGDCWQPCYSPVYAPNNHPRPTLAVFALVRFVSIGRF